jgi:hypothetical protein
MSGAGGGAGTGGGGGIEMGQGGGTTNDDAGFTWRSGAPCPVARFEAMGLNMNGKLLVMGGFISNALDVTRRVDVYDPAADSWSQLNDLPGAQTHVGLVRVDGGALLVGGLLDWPATVTSDVWFYNSAQDSYDARPPLAAPRAAMGVALVGTRVHAIGGLAADGNSDSAAHEVIDLLNLNSGWSMSAALPNPRNHLGTAAIASRIYVLAGRHGWDENTGDQPTLSIFDDLASTWTAGADVPLARSEIAAATFATASRLVVVGGSIAGVQPTDDVSIYDPATDTWTTLPALPSKVKGAVADVIGRSIVVSTGSPTNIDPSATTYIGCCLE